MQGLCPCEFFHQIRRAKPAYEHLCLIEKLEKSPVWDKIDLTMFILEKEQKMANKEQGKDRDKDKKKKKKDKAKTQAVNASVTAPK